ncbi:putative Transcriptional regulator, TetR family [Bradyrhizobium sp. STM 3843]|uniref:TetR/AcrR family transcriptional regulator n=1 Tax=Bradyrhizobium sp. STM 3843 TaxID=551947 RepID=UPI0002407C3C|nr:TetR/AcrR family transcriptional regulator [Bradyrhizobium sp. STM 3843]CCE07513.1 putative Transcriptional regulator, TetR family [Bradyrhizobium sp. STM 3843]
MRYPSDQKAKAKAAILRSGASALRTNGFNGIGVDGLAASAGVTSGAFYSNFANKEALLEQVIATCVGEPFIDSESGSLAERQDRLRDWLAMYISATHRADPASGCVMPTLSADVGRANPQVRAAYERKMLELVRKMANVLDGDGPERERRAWSIIAMMVGAIAISRAMPDGPAADQALESALKTAVALVR